MKKRIISILSALFITAYSIVNCSLVPVLATPVITSEVLFNGLMTLLFSLGVTLDITNLTKDTANDIMQNYIEDSIDGNNLLEDQYQEFLDNLQYGYIVLGRDLYFNLRDNIYNDNIKYEFIVKDIPDDFKSFIGSYSGTYVFYTTYKNDAISNDNLVSYLFCYSVYNNGNYEISNSIDIYNVPVFTRSYGGNLWYRFGNCSDAIAVNFWDNYGTYPTISHGSGGYSNNTNLEFSSNRISDVIMNPFPSNVLQFNNIGNVESNGNDLIFEPLIIDNQESYDLIMDGVWIDNGDFITTLDGDIPQVIDGDTISDIAGDVKSGDLTWEQAIGDIIGSYDDTISPDLPLTPSKLDSLINGLNIERVLTKFPFCIPADLKLIIDGATTVSSNAPVIDIPFHLEYAGTVYYDNEHAIVIDFSDFESVVIIFREGFFLLFLVGLVWLTIDILQAFFVVTE